MCAGGIAAASHWGRGLWRGRPVRNSKHWRWGTAASGEAQTCGATQTPQAIAAAAESNAGSRGADREKAALPEGVLMDRGDLLILLLHGTGAATHGRQEPSLA